MKSVTKKLRESITNNIMLKIAAVFIAALIWLAVVNLSDPTKTITIYGIPINLTDEEAITDQNKVYKVDQRLTLNVTITGKRSVISELSSDDFTAVAPLDEISVANSVQVEVSANKKNVENKISISCNRNTSCFFRYNYNNTVRYFTDTNSGSVSCT